MLLLRCDAALASPPSFCVSRTPISSECQALSHVLKRSHGPPDPSMCGVPLLRSALLGLLLLLGTPPLCPAATSAVDEEVLAHVATHNRTVCMMLATPAYQLPLAYSLERFRAVLPDTWVLIITTSPEILTWCQGVPRVRCRMAPTSRYCRYASDDPELNHHLKSFGSTEFQTIARCKHEAILQVLRSRSRCNIAQCRTWLFASPPHPVFTCAL